MNKEMDQFGRDLLESVRQMKRGEADRITRVEVPMAARFATGWDYQKKSSQRYWM